MPYDGCRCTRAAMWVLQFNQAFSQILKSGRPGGMFPHKIRLSEFSLNFSKKSGLPQDAWPPFWLKP